MLRWVLVLISFVPLNLSLADDIYNNLTLIQAINLTIKFNPNIYLQRDSVLASNGVFQTEIGLFDANLSADGQYTHDSVPRILTQRLFGLSRDITDRNQADLAISKESHEGAVFGAEIGTTSLSSNLQNVLLIGSEKRGQVAFTMQVPLLKGTEAYANTEAAQLNYEATVDELQQVVSQNVLNTTLAYYKLLGARDRYNTLHASVISARKFLVALRKLIKGDERPRSDIHLALAYLQERSNLEIAAKQALLQAKQDLGLSMGIPAEQIYLLQVPTTQLPQVNKQAVQHYSKINILAAEAIQNRADIEAGKKRIEMNDVLIKQARNNMEPQLNINASVGYRGLHEMGPMLSGLSSNISGPVALARVSYSYPIGNHEARGHLVVQFAERSKNYDRLRELIRTIELNINLFSKQLVSSVQQIYQTTAAAKNYDIAVSNEIKKLSIGQATLVDTIRVSDQKLNTDLNNIDNKVTYAISLPELQFESGLLIQKKGSYYIVNLKGIPQ